MKAALRMARAGPLAVTAVVCLALYVAAGLTESDIFSLRAAAGFFSNHAVLGIVAVGMTFVILSGGIDLSVGSVVACAAIAAAVLIERWHWNPAAAIAAVILGAALFGGCMGGLIHAYRLPPFIVTLAAMFIARGAAFAINRESIAIDAPFIEAAHDVPAALARMLGADAVSAQQLAFHLPTSTLIFIFAAAVASIVLEWTRCGRSVYAVGGSEQAARLMGVRVGRTRIMVYAICGGCAGLAGVVHTLSLFSGDPAAHVMLELDAIAAVVIGGTLLSGGVGSIAGTVLGIMIFGIIETWIMMQEGLNSAWTRIIVGGLLLAFILMQQALLRRK